MEKEWLKWEQAYDSKNNSRWYAKAFNGLYFRIQIDLMNNKIVFYESSDDELLLNSKSWPPEMWSTIEDAKYDLDKHHQILKQNDTAGSI